MKAHILTYAVFICTASLAGCSRTIHPLGHHIYYDTNYPSHATKTSTEPNANTKKNNGYAAVNSCAFATTAALALWAASGKDKQLSSYAINHTPIYGSTERALRASNTLEYLSIGIAVLIYTAKYLSKIDDIIDYPATIATNYLPDNTHQYITIGNHIGTDSPPTAVSTGGALILSGAATSTVTEILKKHTARPRPDLSDSLSYPSGHATAAACANQASLRMICGLGLPPRYAYPAYAALSLLTLGTALGRVEGGRHYPSDVLAGIYVGIAFTDASFALYEDASRAPMVRFGINTVNERGVTTTVLSTTVDF